jgi:hypothetical protein
MLIIIAGLVFIVLAILQWAASLSLAHAFDIFIGVLGLLMILGAGVLPVPASWHARRVPPA